jgi:hypothetical protein
MPAPVEHQVTTLTEFTKHVEDALAASTTAHKGKAKAPDKIINWYRGCGKASRKLEPGLYRLVCLLPFLAAEAVFLWLLLRSQRSPKYQINQPRTVTTSELDGAQPRVLQAPSPSVTEHTTHTLEPARSDRNAQ